MTQDNDWIYENRVPFNLLTEQEKEELRAHKQTYVCFVQGRWASCIIGDHDLVYRAARPAFVPDSIDWAHVAPEYKYMARDDDGKMCVYTDKPEIEEDQWIVDGSWESCRVFFSCKRGTVDWKDSLVARPEGA